MFESLLAAFTALFAIMNPVGAAPVFLGITGELTPEQRRSQALRATVATFVILVGAVLIGRFLLDLFGITIAAFRTGGGLVVLLMGLEMLRGERTKVQNPTPHVRKKEEAEAEITDTVIVPFAMPMVAGPGAITTAITFTSADAGWQGHLTVISAAGAVCVVLYLALLSAGWLESHISARSQRIFLRFMGLILLSMGTQFLIDGLKASFFL